MTERTTLAVPTPKRCSVSLLGTQALKPWSEMLQLAVAVMQDRRLRRSRKNPRVPRTRFVEFFLDVCGKRLDKDGATSSAC